MALTRCPFSSCLQQSIVLMCIISDQHFSLVGNITLIPLLFSCLPQNISTGLAIAGVIVIARSIKLITKFQAACDIPTRFIERNVSLRGKVHSITEKGFKVEHVPIYLPVISPLLSKYKGNTGERRS
uniref:Uncharacterized protein n=1 Tax=Pundamilia nyererei TaxID=303518 RepID=A0A3B4GAT2_9CICH